MGRAGASSGAIRQLDRRLFLALVLSLSLVAFYALRYWTSASFAPISGVARVIDGDTIQLSAIRIRLEGIDAPEWDQTCRDVKGRSWWCGRAVSHELERHLEGRPLLCKPQGFDRYQRVLAVCFLPDGSDLNAWLVQQGFAVATGFTSPYRQYETEAKAAARGIWAGSFDLPREWRRRHAH